MWLMTQHAFTSTVYKQVEPGWYMVRGRDRESLELMCELGGMDKSRIYSALPSDYPLRIKVNKAEMMRYFEAELDRVTYSNFKNQAKITRGQQYAGALGKVWSAMWAITPVGLRKMLQEADDKYDREHGLGKYRSRPAAPKAGSSVRYSSGSHPSAVTSGDDDEPAYADTEWWYRNFPKQQDTLDLDADFSDMETDRLVEDVDELFRTKSVHDLTEDEWRSLMEENPGGI